MAAKSWVCRQGQGNEDPAGAGGGRARYEGAAQLRGTFGHGSEADAASPNPITPAIIGHFDCQGALVEPQVGSIVAGGTFTLASSVNTDASSGGDGSSAYRGARGLDAKVIAEMKAAVAAVR